VQRQRKHARMSHHTVSIIQQFGVSSTSSVWLQQAVAVCHSSQKLNDCVILVVVPHFRQHCWTRFSTVSILSTWVPRQITVVVAVHAGGFCCSSLAGQRGGHIIWKGTRIPDDIMLDWVSGVIWHQLGDATLVVNTATRVLGLRNLSSNFILNWTEF